MTATKAQIVVEGRADKPVVLTKKPLGAILARVGIKKLRTTPLASNGPATLQIRAFEVDPRLFSQSQSLHGLQSRSPADDRRDLVESDLRHLWHSNHRAPVPAGHEPRWDPAASGILP